MLAFLIALALTGGAAYYGYTKLIADKLDTPSNNQAVKGLEKAEIKAKIKEDEAKIKTSKEEIKTIEKERQDILKNEKVKMPTKAIKLKRNWKPKRKNSKNSKN